MTQIKLRLGKHVGKIGEKLWLKLKVIDIRQFDSKFDGQKTLIYDMTDDDGNVFSKIDKLDGSFLDDDNETDRVTINSKVSFYA